MKIGIVIPTKNESKNIKPLFLSIKKNLNKKKIILCFVDKSDDEQTIKNIKRYFRNFKYNIIKERKNSSQLTTRCVASNLGFKWLIKNTDVKILVDLDADLAHDPKEINHALNFLEKYDVVIASKYHPKSIVKGRSKLRMLISYSCTRVCQIIISKKISDFSNSYRFYKRECIKKIIKKKIIYKSPIQHLENLIMLINNNYKIKEINTKYIERERGDSSIKVVGLFFYLLEFVHCLTRFSIKKII